MNFKQTDIAKYLKSPDLSVKCVIIFGTNEGMIADYCRQFARTVCPDLNDAFQVSRLNMEQLEKDVGLLFGEYNARSLMGGRRVVIISDGNNNLTAHFKNLFKDSTSDTLVIVTSSTINKKSSLYTLAEKSPEYVLIGCYDDREESSFAFAKAFLVKSGITIGPEAMQLLCSRLSSDRQASANELEKLVTYLGTRRNVEIADVRGAVSDASDSSHDDMCYFAAGGNTSKALEAYNELLQQGDEPVSIVRSLSYHFMKILGCVAAMENGQGADSAASSLKPPLMFFRKNDFILQLRIWKRQSVLEVLDLLYRCERDCKTTNFPAEEILSYTLMQVAGAARRLAR